MSGRATSSGGNDDHSFFLLSPLSTKELFSEDLCSLPSYDHGCSRFRQNLAQSHLPNEKMGIRPQKDTMRFPNRVWLVFSKTEDEAVSLEKYEAIEPNALEKTQKGKHYAAFAFKDSQALAHSPYLPVLARYRAWSKERDCHSSISRWYHSSSSAKYPDLHFCFGGDVFQAFTIPNLTAPFIIAELIRNYLHHHCGEFLKHPKGDRFGLQLCRIKRTPPGGPLHDCAISFSAVNPQSKEIQFWDEPQFGSLAIGFGEKEIQIALDQCHPLTCSSDPSLKVTFADCFTEPFRNHILSKELDQTYLNFSMGEIAAYLLHWVLLRIFAAQAVNQDFINDFEAWQLARKPGKPAPDRMIQHLFKSKVVLPADPNLFKRSQNPHVNTPKLCIFNQPTSFEEVLATIELNFSQAGAQPVLLSTAQFLAKEFGEGAHTHKRSFATLPMYKDLGWKATPALSNLNEKKGFRSESALKKILSEIIASMIPSHFDLTQSGPKESITFEKALEQHTKLSVYPFKHILTNLPRGGPQVSHYLILPLWESTIGEKVRPLIFAHVFRDANSQRQKTFSNYVSKLQRWLLPCGPLLAIKYEPERRENEINTERMIMGGFLAHELNKLLRKQYAGIRQQLIDSKDPNAANWGHAWDHISATAQLAFLSAKSFLSPDSRLQLHRDFTRPLIELNHKGQLLELTWAVARLIYAGSKLEDKGCGPCGAPQIEQLEKGTCAPLAATEEEIASLFLLLGELIRNFCQHSLSRRKGKLGQLKIFITRQKLFIILEDWRPSIPHSRTMESLKNFLQYFEIGELDSKWVVPRKQYQTEILISLANPNHRVIEGESA